MPRRVALLLLLALPGTVGAQTPEARQQALDLLGRAIARMGGEPALRGVTAIRLDVMTQWQRISFADHPYPDQPSYERNVELRDYATRSWRNTRQFLPGPAGLAIVDVVRDTVAARLAPGAPSAPPSWAPLSVAYVDERRELFAFAPERMLLLARESPTLGMLPDTTINGIRHARVRATLDGWDARIALRVSDGLPAMVRFRADETNDFGLAPYGEQEVEFWYSGWTMVPPGVLLPRQRDTRRVGRPYKRMTVLTTTINPPAPADSFAIADSTVTAFFRTQNRPMWAAPLDSARIVQDAWATFPPWAGVAGAVKVGGGWVLIEAGQAPGATQLVADWLAGAAPSVPLWGAIVTWPATGSGGVRWFAEQKLPLYAGVGAGAFTSRMLGPDARAATIVAAPRWIRVRADSLWVEPLDVPDFGGALAVYVPALKWLYLSPGNAPLARPELDAMVSRLKTRGLEVGFIGSVRAFAPPPPRP